MKNPGRYIISTSIRFLSVICLASTVVTVSLAAESIGASKQTVSNPKGAQRLPKNMKSIQILKSLKNRAAEGDHGSEFAASYLEKDGNPVFFSDKALIDWLTSKADQHDPDAQTSLALLYELGLGLPIDINAAADLYEQAAEQGVPLAQNNIGKFYSRGTGRPYDLSKSAEWFQKSAAQGFAWAQFNLGNSYQYGWGIAQDITRRPLGIKNRQIRDLHQRSPPWPMPTRKVTVFLSTMPKPLSCLKKQQSAAMFSQNFP